MQKSGQAIVEYLLILSTAILLAVVIQVGLRKAGNRLWLQMSCEVAAPCPTCRDATPSLKDAEGAMGAPGACTVN